MTYNIRGGLGMDSRRSLSRIAAVAVSVSPEIICFQEVHQRLPWGGGENQPRRLEQMLGMQVIFQRTVNLGFGGFGLAIASRYPVLRIDRHSLPSKREKRGALEVHLRTPLGTLRVFCTHWGLDQGEREKQAARLRELIRDSSTSVIIGGDFNEGPEGAAVQRLLDYGLCDSAAGQNAGTYPADLPTARIDFLLHSPVLHCGRAEVIETMASDHCPVVADLAEKKIDKEALPSVTE